MITNLAEWGFEMDSSLFFKCTIADKWRVTLKGETNDYIHASFANVRLI